MPPTKVEKQKKTTQEVVMVFYENDTPIAIARKNGHLDLFKLRKMTFDEIAHLMEAGNAEH